LIVWSDPNGIVGTFSACSAEAITMFDENGAFPCGGEKVTVSSFSSGVEVTIFEESGAFPLDGEKDIVSSFSVEVES